jgi:hypothetical protein
MTTIVRLELPDEKRAPEIVSIVAACLVPAVFDHAWHLATSAGAGPTPEQFAAARNLALGQWGLMLNTFAECVKITVIPDEESPPHF